MQDLTPIINAGAAGAVIVVVILFLRFLQVQRADDREERMAERTMWTNTLNQHNEQHNRAAERIAHSLDEVTKRIANCPQRGGKD